MPNCDEHTRNESNTFERQTLTISVILDKVHQGMVTPPVGHMVNFRLPVPWRLGFLAAACLAYLDGLQGDIKYATTRWRLYP